MTEHISTHSTHEIPDSFDYESVTVETLHALGRKLPEIYRNMCESRQPNSTRTLISGIPYQALTDGNSKIKDAQLFYTHDVVWGSHDTQKVLIQSGAHNVESFEKQHGGASWTSDKREGNYDDALVIAILSAGLNKPRSDNAKAYEKVLLDTPTPSVSAFSDFMQQVAAENAKRTTVNERFSTHEVLMTPDGAIDELAMKLEKIVASKRSDGSERVSTYLTVNRPTMTDSKAVVENYVLELAPDDEGELAPAAKYSLTKSGQEIEKPIEDAPQFLQLMLQAIDCLVEASKHPRERTA